MGIPASPFGCTDLNITVPATAHYQYRTNPPFCQAVKAPNQISETFGGVFAPAAARAMDSSLIGIIDINPAYKE